MKYNLVTKKNIAIAVFIILVIIATVCFDYFRTLNANNQQLTKMLQAVEENPVSSEIKDKDGNNTILLLPAIGLYLKISPKFNCIQISYFTSCPF